jgi:hypothetical protein
MAVKIEMNAFPQAAGAMVSLHMEHFTRGKEEQ